MIKKIKKNEPILIDFGICYHGYQADQTTLGKLVQAGVLPRDTFSRAARTRSTSCGRTSASPTITSPVDPSSEM